MDTDADLTPAQREALAAGRHAEVAAELLAANRPDLAAAIYEQIWDFPAAYAAYRQAQRQVDALRMALDDGAPHRIDEAVADLHRGATPHALDEAIALLERRRRPVDAARLRQLRADDAALVADDLLDAGDRYGAAQVLAADGRTQAALDLIAPGGEPPRSKAELALAAALSWELGDAERTARFAQRSLRGGNDSPELRSLLARALVSLGHDVAAQMVGAGEEIADNATPQLTGRYRVTGVAPTTLIGAGYLGFDRVTLQDVEIHLLLAEQATHRAPDPEVRDALERFATTALGAAALAHPAVRPVLRLDADTGLLVMPRAEGPTLRSLMRPPGMLATRSRARAMMAFLAEGLAAAHTRGFVHGWLLPSLIACDALGRPQLGPFGAHHLSGLAATYTGSLDEIMLVSSPELRRGEPPSIASDLYALGALCQALLLGTLRPDVARAPDLVELSLAAHLTDPDPARRPDLGTVLSVLRRPLPNVTDLRAAPVETTANPTTAAPRRDEVQGLVVEAAASWPDTLLDRLCAEAQPWTQPVLDRDGRRFTLAPWPEGCKSLQGVALDWSRVVPQETVSFTDPELQAAVHARLQGASFVRTPAGHWMLALDDLLTR